MRRALISVSDKTELAPFARGLAELGFELVASGGTAEHLEAEGLAVTSVESLTEFPALLGGRVKTLHPAIHGGILARPGNAVDAAELEREGIEPFDLVCVDLYPFERAAASRDAMETDVIEQIDVGGPALLRAAAKNHARVAAVTRPEDYDDLLGELRARHGESSPETRRRLAGIAFAATAAYEAAIARWFGEEEQFPQTLIPVFEKVRDLVYGENPHQAAALYAERGVRSHLLSMVEQLHGRELSFNNLNDLDAARLLVREFALPACVIVKHANPCGVAVAATIEGAYERALGADPLSAYGGVVVLNRAVTVTLGQRLAEQFVEVLFAPGFAETALEALVRKPATRILNNLERRQPVAGEHDYKRVIGGLLVQERDGDVDDREGMSPAAGKPSETQWGDLLFAWRVCKHVVSNAIVIARDLQTIGIGAGQVSRVDAVRIAIEKAREHGHSLEGAALASDAFFPFPDGPRLALDAGVSALIQPGGSKRDGDVIDAVESAGATMVFTGRRHFRH
ncbi:MAG: bifunctional phosphoribosylaminoimidazolecarboxamide formyltransferase/IMP cyclohydrolase [Gaiellaceae bacterium MAG52_C11]|nr:bifunctional phosphoribosylaminoimidazolecarboxamide formyltransferase/IMP cyclohydrolase [Candidatus Gaiellasilicea maunaloa]